MPYITPATDPTPAIRCRFLQVPDDIRFYAAVIGALYELTKPHNWEQVDPQALTPQQAADAMLAMMELLDDEDCSNVLDCDCIKNLNFNPATGVLSYVDANGNTITVLNEGDVTNEVNPYALPSLPQVGEKDIYCYAAQQLAKNAADDLQDMIEFIDIVEDFTEGLVSAAAKSLLGAIPVFGQTAVEVVEYQSDVIEGVYDWIRVNATDIDAIDRAAEILYCAFQVALADNDPSDLRAEIIDEAGANLEQFTIDQATQLVRLLGLPTVVQGAYDSQDAEFMAYPIIAFLLAQDALFDVLGQEKPLDAYLAQAARDAVYFDSRDCANYNCAQEWTHTFLNGDGLETTLDTIVWGSHDVVNDWIEGVYRDVSGIDKRKEATIKFNFASPVNITEIHFFFDVQPDAAQPKNYGINAWNVLGGTVLEQELYTAAANGSVDWTGDIDTTEIAMQATTNADGGTSGFARITAISISGTGANPFIP